MLKKLFKYVDYVTLSIVFILFLIGITALYSANGGVGGDTSEVSKQVLWFALGAVLVTLLIVIDYSVFEKIWLPFYGVIMVLLILVLFTQPINRCDKLV